MGNDSHLTQCLSLLRSDNQMVEANVTFLEIFLEMPDSPLVTQPDEMKIGNWVTVLSESSKFVVALVYFQKKTWIRISCNVYNSENDFVKLRDRLASFFKIPLKSE